MDLFTLNPYEKMKTKHCADWKSLFAQQIARDTITRESWLKIQRPFKRPRAEELAVLIDKLINFEGSLIEKNSKVLKGLKEIKKNPIWLKTDDSFFLLSQALGQSTSKKIAEKRPDLNYLEKMYHNSFIYPKHYHNSHFDSIISIQYRNLGMAENIAKLYCKASERGKDLALIMGAAHVDGVLEIIKQSSQGKIHIILHRDAHTDFDARLD